MPPSPWPAVDGGPQGQKQPPFCQNANSHCVLAPVSDTTADSAVVPGVKVRTISYGLYALKGAQLTPLFPKISRVQVVLSETRVSGSGVICDQITAPFMTNCTDDDSRGFEDILTAGSTGATVQQQQFFVQRGLAKVFWPLADFDSNGLPTTNWVGAFSQTATTFETGPRIQQSTRTSSMP